MPTPPKPSLLPSLGCLILLCIALQVALGPHVRLSQWRVPPDANEAWLEAAAWLHGRVDIGRPGYDLALVDGRWYNPLPPLFTLICAGVMLIQRMVSPAAAPLFDPPLYVLVIAVPLVLSGYWALREVLRGAQPIAAAPEAVEPTRSAWAALLTFAWLAGTSMLPTLLHCREGNLNYINHALSQVGLFLLAGDLLGRRRGWPAAAGLIIAAWSRQLTLLYALPWLWLEWSHVRPDRGRRVGRAAAVAALAVGGLLAVNTLRFGNPLDSGYAHIYPKRTALTDVIAARAREYGVFNVRCIPFNAWYMNFYVPQWEWSPVGPRPVNAGPGDKWGASLWLASPLLLFVFVDARRWWRDAARRSLMLGSLAVVLGFLCYHNSGATQFGHFRFSLDVVPVWLAVIAPYAVARPRAAWTLACTAWSAWYFTTLAG